MPLFELQNKLLSIKVNSFGAELCSVVSKDSSIEYIWQADKAIWARHAPNLFPIVGKLKDGHFNYQTQWYQLSQHGFARDLDFICVEQAHDYLLFELVASEQTLACYPFHFSLRIGYRLINNKIEASYSVFNPDSKDLYFSVGAHPAFNCPLQNNESFSDYQLLFPDKNKLKISTLNDGLITSHTKTLELDNHHLKVSQQLFNNDALVFMNSQIDEVQLLSSKTQHGVSLISKNWPYFGIWTKKGSNQFICFEPWHGVADHEDTKENFQTKEGIIKLATEQHFDCSFEMVFF